MECQWPHTGCKHPLLLYTIVSGVNCFKPAPCSTGYNSRLKQQMPLHFVDRKFFIADAVVYHALGRVVEIA